MSSAPPTAALSPPISLSRVRSKKLDLRRIRSPPDLPSAASTMSSAGEPSRRIRAVPPSAIYDPPTPPSPAHTPLPELATARTAGTASTGASRRPRLRLRYSSDESGTDSDSEEEVPWWTFTNRGMVKMRQRRTREQAAGIEDGREREEEPEPKERQRIRTRFRKSSRDDPDTPDKGKKPSPMRTLSHFTPDHLFRRQSDRSDSEPEPTRKPIKRSNSAPGSPEVQVEAPPISASLPLYPPQRQASAPLPIDGGHASDSEAHMAASPRVRAKSKLNQSLSNEDRPRGRRMNSHQLRIRLPPPITQHFSNGWPHAGSWQDALRGTYDTPSGTDTRERETTPPRDRRPRRARRYREALAPPTPNGLGFKPRDQWKAGDARPGEFSWSVPEGDELSRTNSRITQSEKGEPRKRGPRIKRTNTKRNLEDWRTRWRRMLFLDARLTIYIRLVDLAAVATALGLAVSIRLSLIRLNLPGLIGSSTTLLIAFASFTLLHGVMAIYREYFGKPIGLWGLRSKMLWVCLDILFVALWASVLSLAVNDYISTPLECGGDAPWWTAGLSTGYARLLDSLGIDPADVVDPTEGSPITGVDLIKATLGIVLPDQVVESDRARGICYRQRGCIALSLLSLLLYGGNMVLSLFRIFETVRRSANVSKAVMV